MATDPAVTDSLILATREALHHAQVQLIVIANTALEAGAIDAAQQDQVRTFRALHTTALSINVGGWWWQSQLESLRRGLDLVTFALRDL